MSLSSKAKSKKILRSCLPFALLAMFELGIIAPLFTGKKLYWGDLMLYFVPMYHYARVLLVRGRLPLWNPYMLMGQPYAGNPQIGLFFPGFWLLPFFSSWNAVVIQSGLMLYTAGVFLYCYLKRHVQHDWAAVAGAICWTGGGAVLGRMQFPPMFCSIACIPLLLLMLEKVLDLPTPANALTLALSITLMLLAAHPQVAYISFLLLAPYGMWYWNRSGRGGGKLKAVMLSLLLGIGLSAVQLLPVIELALNSSRQTLSPLQANRFHLRWYQAVTLLIPHYVGSPVMADYWGQGNAWEPALFMGWLPIIFVLYLWINRQFSPYARIWTALSLFFFWMSFGVKGGLYYIAFYCVPGISRFHDAGRYLIPATLAFAIVASYGVEAWLLRVKQHKILALSLLFAGLIVPLWVYSPDWLPATSQTHLTHTPSVAQLLQHHPYSRVYTPVHSYYSDQFISEGYRDYGSYSLRALHGEEDTLDPNTNLMYQIRSASGYEPVPLLGAAVLDGMVRQALIRNDPEMPSLLRVMGVEYLLYPRLYHISQPGLQPVLLRNKKHFKMLNVSHASSYSGLAWGVRRIEYVPNDLRALASMTSAGFDTNKEAVVFTSTFTDELSASDRLPGKIHILDDKQQEYSTQRVLNLSVSGGTGFLVLSQSAYPGWHLIDNNHRIKLYRTDINCLGCFLSKGFHHILLMYHPITFLFGLYISCLSMSVTAGSYVYNRFGRKRVN